MWKRASVQAIEQLKSSCSRRLEASGPNCAAADIWCQEGRLLQAVIDGFETGCMFLKRR